jgi:hypothetical protein
MRAKILQDKVNMMLLSMCDIGSPLDGILLDSGMFCVIGYEPQELPSLDQEPKTMEGEQGEKKTQTIGSALLLRPPVVLVPHMTGTIAPTTGLLPFNPLEHAGYQAATDRHHPGTTG